MTRRKLSDLKSEVLEGESSEETVLDAVQTGTVEASDSEVSKFSVFDKYGKFVREYSIDIHGEKAEELARQFANKIKGSVK